MLALKRLPDKHTLEVTLANALHVFWYSDLSRSNSKTVMSSYKFTTNLTTLRSYDTWRMFITSNHIPEQQ